MRWLTKEDTVCSVKDTVGLICVVWVVWINFHSIALAIKYTNNSHVLFLKDKNNTTHPEFSAESKIRDVSLLNHILIK